MDHVFSRLIVEARAGGVRLREREGRDAVEGLVADADISVDGGPIQRLTFGAFTSALNDRGVVMRAVSDQSVRAVLTWYIADADPGAIIEATITNFGEAPIHVHRIRPFACEAAKEGHVSLGRRRNWSFFRMGWQSWSATRAFRVQERVTSPRFRFLRDMEENPVNPGSGRPGEFISEQMALISDIASLHTLALGFVSARRGFGDVSLAVEPSTREFGHLNAVYHLDGIECGPGQSVSSEPLWVSFSRVPDRAARQWAELAGHAMDARTTHHPPMGWCSWYHYFTKIDEVEMDRNLRHLEDARKWLPLNLVQLDDGYQKEIGDWLETNEKFPNGVAPLMRRIDAARFEPGLWTAPFIARPGSRLFREHREWFLKTPKGRPVSGGWNPLWGGRVYALDPTHPGAREYLHRVFSTMRREWGVRFFKLDFLYAAALPAQRHAPNTSRARALRIGLETIREAVGDDAFILGCGCPLGPAVGIVDAMRIGCDVTPKWHNRFLSRLFRDENVLSTEHALRNVLTRSFLHGALWTNDPDCLMIRRRNTQLTDDEVRAMASVFAITGGMMMVSDDMSLVEADRMELAGSAAELRTPGARVPEMMSAPFPETAVAELPFGYLVLAANWGEFPRERSVDLSAFIPSYELAGAASVRDVWTKRDYPIDRFHVNLGILKPRQTRLMFLDTAVEQG